MILSQQRTKVALTQPVGDGGLQRVVDDRDFEHTHPSEVAGLTTTVAADCVKDFRRRLHDTMGEELLALFVGRGARQRIRDKCGELVVD